MKDARMATVIMIACIAGSILLFVQAQKEKSKGNSYAMAAFIALGIVLIGFVVFYYWLSGILLSFFGLK